VYDYYPAGDNPLIRFGRFLHLNVPGGHRASWIDAVSGEVTPFAADDGLMERAVASPDGSRLVVQGSSGISVWELPPRRSWVATAVVAGLLFLIYAMWTAVRWRIAARARPVPAGSGEKALS
jgi:hypothetical protein